MSTGNKQTEYLFSSANSFARWTSDTILWYSVSSMLWKKKIFLLKIIQGNLKNCKRKFSIFLFLFFSHKRKFWVSDNKKMPVCSVCGAQNAKRCGRCGQSYYCSRSCIFFFFFVFITYMRVCIWRIFIFFFVSLCNWSEYWHFDKKNVGQIKDWETHKVVCGKEIPMLEKENKLITSVFPF